MQVLARGPGPSDPPAARAGAGFTSVEPFVIELPPGAGVASFEVPLPDVAGHRLVSGDRLTYVCYPVSAGDPANEDAFYAATALALDITFGDGSRLSALQPADQHGTPVLPHAQCAAKTLYVDQWNARTIALDSAAGRVVKRVIARVQRHPGQTLTVFLDDVGIARAPARPADALGWVRTTRGTHSSARFSRGNTAPIVAVPHGGVFGIPMTDAAAADWPYAYHARGREPGNRPAIQAFATSHLPSPWVGDRGVFQLMPSPLGAPDCDRVARALPFDHADEEAGPHRYRVRLAGGIVAELTAADFALGFRFTLPAGRGSLILDHHGAVTDVRVWQESGAALVEARLDDRAGTPAHYLHLRVPGVVADRTFTEGGRLGGYLVVAAGPAGVVEPVLGISTIGFGAARENMAAAGGFDDMLAAARRRWAAVLTAVEVSGATDDQLTSLYSSLYRLFLYPNRHAEAPGGARPRYRSPVDGEVREGSYSANHGFWDTYRTCWPAFALLSPDEAGRLAQGFVQHYVDGGWTSRWSAPGPLDAMTGTTTDTVFASLAAAGVPGIDLEAAYESAVKNATVPSPCARTGRKRLGDAIFLGYTPSGLPEGLSWTLDNALNDWGVAVLARTLLERTLLERAPRAARLRTEYEYFARRSLAYRHVFHGELGFFIGRGPDGAWRVPADAYDPAIWGYDYTETNGWGTAFTVPHDGEGLARLHGGPAGLGTALDRFFATRETGDLPVAGSYGQVIHEMPEARDVRMGMLGLSNQPAHHIPFMYMFAGRHDDAHRIIAEARARLFLGSEIGQGYPGDEDNGEMSAWYVFCALGLYPLVPSTATFVLVPPLFPRIVLRPAGGAALTISVRNPEARGRYISRVWVNGAAWDDISIDHATLKAGGTIEFELSPAPCGWAADTRPLSAGRLHGFQDLLTDRLAASAGPGLTDDAGATVVHLAAGETAEFPLTRPGRPGLYTVTTDQPGEFSWETEWLSAAGRVVARDRRVAEPFNWPRQTRPFAPSGAQPVPAGPRASHEPAERVRLTARSACRLRQLEVFAADASAP
ncbi:MAG TPA: GH92 family glycosyl hydrolase [Trebonia sp.]|nr:GH92 family glycosyl hydrolase [Trebonia sp.]